MTAELYRVNAALISVRQWMQRGAMSNLLVVALRSQNLSRRDDVESKRNPILPAEPGQQAIMLAKSSFGGGSRA